MSKLVWDDPAERMYEIGLDRGVLYLEDGSAVPWNGLTSVVQTSDKESTPIYYDGMKVADFVDPGNYVGTMTAITYPDEFMEFEGFADLADGAYVGDQPSKSFDLSWRTHVGNAIEGDEAGYKINILYNVTAVPSDKTYSTIGESPGMSEFSWNISAVPQEYPGIRPTAHIVLDSRKVDPTLFEELEFALYGGDTASAQLPPFNDLMKKLFGFFLIQIIDNKNGTFTARSNFDGYIWETSPGMYKIKDANITVVDVDTYVIRDTKG